MPNPTARASTSSGFRNTRSRCSLGTSLVRVRDIVRRVASEHELQILSGKVARDHVHVLVSYRPMQRVSQIVQWLKGTSSRVLLQEFLRLRKQFWGKPLWARGYLAVATGSVTDEVIRDCINEQAGEQTTVDFQSTRSF